MKNLTITRAILTVPKFVSDKIIFAQINVGNFQSQARLLFESSSILLSLRKDNGICRIAEKNYLYSGICSEMSKCLNITREDFVSEKPSHLMILFPSTRIIEFITKRITSYTFKKSNDILSYKQEILIHDYALQMGSWIESGTSISPALIEHKFEELLVILWDYFSLPFFSYFIRNNNYSESNLTHIVHDKLMENLTIEELAKQSHKSLSSFKRDFERIYGMPPGRYIREKKLELAAQSILSGKKASEIYMDYGFETTSNFINAFKRKFKCTTKEFRNRYSLN